MKFKIGKTTYTLRKNSLAWYIGKALKFIGYTLLMLYYIIAMMIFIWFMILL